MHTTLRTRFHFALGIIFSAALSLAGADATAAAKVDFNRDIRPILSDTCFACHGPDAKQLKGGLRLDLKESAFQAGKSGVAPIVPGKPEQSAVYQRVTTAGADEQMPPKKFGKQLSAAQVQTLRRWIAEGATYQSHWAFTAPVRPALPAVANAAWPRNGIDHFILARLEHEGLPPGAAAEKTTLIRRVSLDLTGIPPTPEEVAAFVADTSPRAYETLVDRLLASPRYGERMAMQWLDYARYADSHGFQTDSSRQMWPWRDWVINAFNENKPFDQFTIDQIAGDLLPAATRAQTVATGFHRNHRINGEGGLIAEEWRIENIIDRVETTGLTWLALTLNCCRCHDHKYDPISQREFYQLFAFFNNIAESGTIQGVGNRGGGNPDPFIKVPTTEQETRLAELDTKHKAALARIPEAQKELPKLLAAWEATFREQLAQETATWIPLNPSAVKSLGGATLTRQEDGAYLASGKNPAKDVYELTAPLTAGQFGGLLLEAFPDASLPNESLGRNANGNFVLSKVEAEITAPGLAEPIEVEFEKAEADYSQTGYGIASLLPAPEAAAAPKGKGKPKAKAPAKTAAKPATNRGPGWAIDGPTKKEPRKAMLLTGDPVNVPTNATLTVRLRHEALDNHNIGRFRLSATALPAVMVKLDGTNSVPAAIKSVLAVAPEKRNARQLAELEKFYRANFDNPVKRAETAATAAKKAMDDLEASLPASMVMKELPTPRDAFLLVRGEYDKKGDAVQAGLPAVLPPMPAGSPTNRLGLARWLVDPANPLTARVWVNRQWEKFMGTGLVKTTENFGSQADHPSHPELLDWLATEFVRLGWDMKALQKVLVLSAAYQQSSKVSPELATRDPENRLLARGPRFRLPGELVRDQALAVSGLLVGKIGGPSVRPYMPAGVWDETSRYGDLRGYKHDQNDGLYRRSFYTIWKRTAAPPTMLLFDAPTRETCVVKRSRTNTPLQALALLNEVTFVEAARALAQRMMTAGGTTPAERIADGFRRVTARQPDAGELQVLVSGLEKRLAHYRADAAAAGKLVAVGDSPALAKLDVVELAAYTVTANVLLNLDEVVTRE